MGVVFMCIGGFFVLVYAMNWGVHCVHNHLGLSFGVGHVPPLESNEV